MKKNLLYMALGFGAFFAVSCSGDDGPSYTESDLIKKWYYVSDVVGGVTIPYDDHEDCGKDYIEFKAGGIVREVDVWDCEEYVDELTWVMNGNKVTISFEAQSSTATIKKLTDTTLQVQFQDDWDEDGDVETVTENYTSLP